MSFSSSYHLEPSDLDGAQTDLFSPYGAHQVRHGHDTQPASGTMGCLLLGVAVFQRRADPAERDPQIALQGGQDADQDQADHGDQDADLDGRGAALVLPEFGPEPAQSRSRSQAINGRSAGGIG